MTFLIPLLLLYTLLTHSPSNALLETDRLHQYHTRNYTWPPKDTDYNPNTPGWNTLYQRRFQQIHHMTDPHDTYNSYVSTVHSALLLQNFTENGWGITHAPKSIVDELVHALHQGLSETPKLEHSVACIETNNPPYMIPTQPLIRRILNELLPVHESWANVPLHPNNAYGLRVYRNDSMLNMHYDKPETHVISSILHIDHSQDSEPWPLVIEDLQGTTNEVILESGDMLFYESSKLLHGRPRKFQGSWYCSLFLHYHPVDWVRGIRESPLDAHYRIPPTWDQVPSTDEIESFSFETLVPVGTSFKETECENDWCALETSVKWRNSTEYGKVMSVGGVVRELRGCPKAEDLGLLAKDRHAYPMHSREELEHVVQDEF